MKQLLFILMTVAFFATAQAKKVKVTIDGTVSPSQTTLYLIVNEDTAQALRVPIQDAQFSVTVTVDRDAFIRLNDSKKWPESSAFVLIPDSRHITVNWNTGSIEGSEQSHKLKFACREIRENSPEGFHVDVFSDDPGAWRRAQAQGESIRQGMLEAQRNQFKLQMQDKKNNLICAWLAYCYPQLLEGEIGAMLEHMKKKPKWMNHPILKGKLK